MKATFFFLEVTGSDDVIATATRLFGEAVQASRLPSNEAPAPSALPGSAAPASLPDPAKTRSSRPAAAQPSGRRAVSQPTQPPATAPTPRQAKAEPTRKRRKLLLECRERPGETFTYAQLAKVVGVKQQSLYSKISAQKQFRAEWAIAADFHFRLIAGDQVAHAPAARTSSTAVDPGEAKSRFSHRAAPINTQVVVGNDERDADRDEDDDAEAAREEDDLDLDDEGED